MPRGEIDLSAGAVLHIRGFTSRGHQPKNKFVLIIGQFSASEILGFLISSQLSYLQVESHKPECIRIPSNATAFLAVESIIQCFQLERLDSQTLCSGFDAGRVTNEGRLPVKYLYKIREAVEKSFLLAQVDIDDCLKVLP